jgi:hypothetical protein
MKLFETGVVPLAVVNTLTPTANAAALAYTVITVPAFALLQQLAELPPGPTTNGYNALVVVDVVVVVGPAVVEVEVEVVEVDVVVVDNGAAVVVP